MDLSEAILRRRSVRRFDRSRPVPRDLVLAVLDAARWAPSSCNLQTWDFVLVEDPALRERVAAEARSVAIAPVAVFVVYDRELAREGQANVQSASAAVMTMLLAATAKGLASLWVNAIGDRDRLRELLGVPPEFEVLALVCLGWPAQPEPLPAPERRPLDEVVHVDRYRGGNALPRSPDPGDWSLEQIAAYAKRKLQSGTRFNKPDPNFVPPVMAAVRAALEHDGAPPARVLDVLPAPGLFAEELAAALPAASLAALEISAENHFFVTRRAASRFGFVPWPAARREAILAACAPPGEKVAVLRESGGLIVMPRTLPFPELSPGPAEGGAFDAATVLFRLEGIPPAERPRLLADVHAALRAGGRLVVAYTSRRSWHGPAYAARRRFGRDSVEVAPAPEPNLIGPYEALSPGAVRWLVRAAGFTIERESRLLPLPDVLRLAPRVAKAKGPARALGRAFLFVARALAPLEPLLRPFSRVRVLSARKP